MVFTSEVDILDSEPLCSGAVLWRGVCVFTHPEEEVKSNADEVAESADFWVCAGEAL